MKTNPLVGFLFIGDPHAQGRAPDFRCDDYPNVIIDKISWCLDYCDREGLLPILLGDLFDKPRDNPTWMLARLIEVMLGREVICIYGNHDCAEPELTEHDSLMLLLKSGCLRLVSDSQRWTGTVAGRHVFVGGSSYREWIPDQVDLQRGKQFELFPEKEFGVWLTHHDIEMPGYEAGRIAPFEIRGVDILVNGHIHTRSEPVQTGGTIWFNPGNISRRTRSEKSQNQPPAALRIDLNEKKGFDYQYVEIPHEDFEDVFHKPAFDEDFVDGGSAFIAGLSELQQRRTQSGAGLRMFLEKNLGQFSDSVAEEIRNLAFEVTGENIN